VAFFNYPSPTKGLLIFNRVRIWFGDEIEKLKPLVHDAYRHIHAYQLNRTPVNESKVRESIGRATPILQLFIQHIPAYKAKYIQILQQQQELKPSDLIICFDRAIYELHLYATIGRSGAWSQEPWSKELRALLDERQAYEQRPVSGDETFLTSGKPACSGEAQGPAALITSMEDLPRVTKGSILVTPMTTPDFIEIAGLLSGLVTDRGGVVCHAAILAREFNIPCIVGCGDATRKIRDGQLIRMDAVSGIIMGCEET